MNNLNNSVVKLKVVECAPCRQLKDGGCTVSAKMLYTLSASHYAGLLSRVSERTGIDGDTPSIAHDIAGDMASITYVKRIPNALRLNGDVS